MQHPAEPCQHALDAKIPIHALYPSPTPTALLPVTDIPPADQACTHTHCPPHCAAHAKPSPCTDTCYATHIYYVQIHTSYTHCHLQLISARRGWFSCSIILYWGGTEARFFEHYFLFTISPDLAELLFSNTFQHNCAAGHLGSLLISLP